MSLRDRLTRLTGEAADPSAAAQQDRISELRRKIDRVMNRRERSVVPGPPPTRRHVTPLEQVVAGGEARTPYGSFFLCDSTMGAREAHGSVRIGDVGCLGGKQPLDAGGIAHDLSPCSGCPQVRQSGGWARLVQWSQEGQLARGKDF